MKYNPLFAPNPKRWLALDEMERIILIEKYHRRMGVKLPDLTLHATMHAAVENQLAEETDERVEQALKRVMGAGLDRHDAIHAVASVLCNHIWNLKKRNTADPDNPHEAYYKELEELTAKKWMDSAPDEQDER